MDSHAALKAPGGLPLARLARRDRNGAAPFRVRRLFWRWRLV